MISFKPTTMLSAAPTIHGKWIDGTKAVALLADGGSIGFIHPPVAGDERQRWRIVLAIADYTHFTWTTLKPEFATVKEAQSWVTANEDWLLNVLPLVHRMREV